MKKTHCFYISVIMQLIKNLPFKEGSIYFCLALLLGGIHLLPLNAQPSGGPYGPVPQNYTLPKTEGKIYYVSTDGKPDNSGNSAENATTIETAISKAVSGDAIILRGGIYRTGNLIINQGITIQAYADEQPVLKGTYVASDWKDLRNGLWTTSWTHLFPSEPQDWWQRNRSGKETPMHRFNNDMVFIDGKFLQSAGWEGEVDENSFYIDYKSGLVYIGTDPKDKLVEITAFDVALHRITGELNGRVSDKKGPVIKGIVFTQYAYRAIEIDGTDPEGVSPEANHGKEVVGTFLENCEISFCSRVAAYLRGDKLVIRNCKVTDTSTEGIYVLSSSDVLLERNIFSRNNIEQITGYYPAAVKIFNQCYRVTCQDNLVIDHPYSNGIWYDVGNVDGRFLNNRVENVGSTQYDSRSDQLWPSNNGFFFEISKGAICAGNVFVNCDHGILILNSSDVTMVQNTFVNSTACIGRNSRSAVGDHFGWHPATGPDVEERDGHIFMNNLLTGDQNYRRPLLFVWQPADLCERLGKPQFSQVTNNVYVSIEHAAKPVIYWSPAVNEKCQAAFDNFSDFANAYPGFSASSKSYKYGAIPLFKSYELENYQLIQKFPGNQSAVKLSPELVQLLGFTKNYKQYVGAFP